MQEEVGSSVAKVMDSRGQRHKAGLQLVSVVETGSLMSQSALFTSIHELTDVHPEERMKVKSMWWEGLPV